MVIDFALPINHDLEEGYKSYEGKTKTAVADYALHMAVTRFDKKACLFSHLRGQGSGTEAAIDAVVFSLLHQQYQSIALFQCCRVRHQCELACCKTSIIKVSNIKRFSW